MSDVVLKRIHEKDYCLENRQKGSEYMNNSSDFHS
jgi:hypothetical protein